MTDEALLNGLKQGDHASIKYIYETFFPDCARVVLKNGGEMDDAREVFQIAFCSLLEKLGDASFNVKSTVGGYIYTSCKYIWWGEHKRKSKWRLLDIEEVHIPDTNSLEDNLNVDELEKIKRLHTCLNELKEDCRKLLKLSFKKDKIKDAEIAAELNYTAQYVKTKRKRCMKKLRKCMGVEPY